MAAEISYDELTAVAGTAVHFVAAVPAGARPSSLALARLDAAEIDGDRDLLTALGPALDFPDYNRVNWDALDECLRDLPLGPQGHHRAQALLLTGADTLWRRHPRTAGRLVEAWLAAAEEWSRDGVAFHLVFVW